MREKVAYRVELDAGLADKKATEERKERQELREAEEGKMFAQAKRVSRHCF